LNPNQLKTHTSSRLISSLIIASSTLIGCIFAEAVLRYAEIQKIEPDSSRLTAIFNGSIERSTWGEIDAEIGWVNKEGNEFISKEPGNNRITNWPGYKRATGESVIKKSSLPTIDIYGDSWTNGQGAPDLEAFPSVLNYNLSRYFVQNYGTPGYSTFQSYLLMKRTITDKTRVAVFCLTPFMNWRDLEFYSTINSIKDKKTGVPIRPPFLIKKGEKFLLSPSWITTPWFMEGRSFLIQHLHSLFIRIYAKLYSPILAKNELDNIKFTQDTTSITEQIVRMQVNLTKEHNSEYLFVMLTGTKDPRWKGLVSRLNASGINAIDCDIPNFDNSYLNGGVTGMHPNGKAHRFYSKCIEDELKTLLKY
jgi:hypothetical protein